jgi:hypothetical protein
MAVSRERRASTDDIFKRLSVVEQDTATLSANVVNLTHAIESLAGDIRSIKDNNKTNWGTLAAWASVIVAVMVYHNNLAVIPIKENCREIKSEISRIRDWKDRTEGQVPQMEEKFNTIQELIKMYHRGPE